MQPDPQDRLLSASKEAVMDAIVNMDLEDVPFEHLRLVRIRLPFERQARLCAVDLRRLSEPRRWRAG